MPIFLRFNAWFTNLSSTMKLMFLIVIFIITGILNTAISWPNFVLTGITAVIFTIQYYIYRRFYH